MTVGRLTKPLLVSLFVWAVLFGAPAFAKVPSVMVSLLPIHSLVQGVMGDLGEAELLLPGGASPHGFSLKPSQVRALARADLVIRVSADLETFLNKPISTLSNEAKIVILIDTDDLQLFEIREGGDWEAHEEEAQEAEGRHAPDPHIWLSPKNATTIVWRIAEELAALDAGNAKQIACHCGFLRISRRTPVRWRIHRFAAGSGRQFGPGSDRRSASLSWGQARRRLGAGSAQACATASRGVR